MKPRTASLIFTNAVVALAVLIAAYVGNGWTALVTSSLFAFTAFPRWRSKLYHLIEKAIEKLGGGDDRCDPK